MPPGVVGSSAGGISVRVDSVLQSEIDDTPHDGVSLRGRPGVVHPVVPDGECSSELGKVLFKLGRQTRPGDGRDSGTHEEVSRVPAVRCSSEGNGRRVTTRSLPRTSQCEFSTPL